MALGMSLGTVCSLVCVWQAVEFCLHSGLSALASTTWNQ